MTLDLFADTPQAWREEICEGAMVLRGFALSLDSVLCEQITALITVSPLQKMFTPSGLPMSVATTSCGAAGWVSDCHGYRYVRSNPQSQQPWPAMPRAFFEMAQRAALAAGFKNFCPDSCLINCYAVGAKMSLHQDKNEKDFTQPIVSFSFGLPATFLLGGASRSDKTVRVPLLHGDVVVWGGASRMRFHGVLPVKAGVHHLLGSQRINLTFRKAL